MLKSTLPRQARLFGHVLLRGATSQTSLRLTQRPINQMLGRRSGPISLALQLPSRSRLYSSAVAEAPEANDDVAPAAPQRVTRFAELEDLGVHAKLVDSITAGMGYDTMTDVQSLTIDSALTGMDMYVNRSHHPPSLFSQPPNPLQCRTGENRHRKDAGLSPPSAPTDAYRGS